MGFTCVEKSIFFSRQPGRRKNKTIATTNVAKPFMGTGDDRYKASAGSADRTPRVSFRYKLVNIVPKITGFYGLVCLSVTNGWPLIPKFFRSRRYKRKMYNYAIAEA